MEPVLWHPAGMRLTSRLRATLALLLLLGAAAACGSDFRRGGNGETCGRTDDCEAPLVCIAMTCRPPGSAGSSAGGAGAGGTTGGAGGTTGGSGGTAGSAPAGGTGGAGEAGGTGGAGASGGTGGTGGVVLDPELCAACLDQECGAELTACDAECFALEACIEVLCTHLSAIGSPEEGQCQVHCQQAHSISKAKHIAVVNCVLGTNCAPCSSYPFDHDACVAKADQGSCKAQRDACVASADCTQYRDCVAVCATLADCLACDDTAGGMAGAPLLTDYETCIAKECIAESWLK